MAIPAYFTTSPVNGGTPLTINAPPVGGIVYDFIGTSGARVTAYYTASDLPAFTSSAGEVRLLSSAILPQRAITALGGGIVQLGIRLTIFDGDTDPGNFDANEAFLTFNNLNQLLNLTDVQTITHNGVGDSNSNLQQGYPNEVLATGWGLITDTTKLTNLYNSIISGNGAINLQWQSLPNTGGGNVLDYQRGLDQSIINFPSVLPNLIPTFNLTIGSDTGRSNTDAITSSTTPALSGKAVAGDTLNLYRETPTGRVLLGTTTADGSGNWNFTPPTPLPEGTYDVIVDAVDGSGNVLGSASAPITIDTTAPNGPVITGISNDSGVAGDGITNDTTLVISGTAEANSLVDIFQNGNKIGTVTANNSGNWSLDYTGTTLSDGTYNFTATATDVAGNLGPASAPFNVIIDTTAPNGPVITGISNDSGVAGDGITNDTTLVISGTAEANSLVDIFQNGNKIGTVTANNSGNWSLDYTGTTLSDGTYNFTATATDAAGNLGPASAPLNITIDTTVPSASSAPDMTAATDTGVSNTDNITSDNTPTFTGTSAPNSTVQVFDGSTALGTVTADGSGNWIFTPSNPLSEGAHTITARTTDVAGNLSPASSPLNITIDTSAPSAPSAPDMTAATDTGVSNTDNLTNDNTPTFTGTAAPNSTVQVFDGSTALGTATADGSGNWSFTPSSPLSEGAHTITATATDGAGNVSPASAPLNITIDTTAPTSIPSTPDMTAATDTGASNTDNLTSDNTPTFTGTAAPNSTVQVFDGSTVLGTATADGSGNWSFTPSSSLSDGGHTITARIVDTAGNLGPASSALNITIDTSAPSAPSAPDMTAATDTGASSTDNITGDNTPTFAGTAAPNSTVQVFDGSTALGTVTADGSGNWSFTPSSPLSDGGHTITARASDGAGNVSPASAALSITINTSPSGAPSAPDMTAATDTGASNIDNITSDSTPTFTGVATANSVVEVFDGTTSLGTTTADGSGNWSFTPSSSLADGGHILTATATDTAGNVSPASAPTSITVDTSVPSAPSPDLATASDTGFSDTDNLTSDSTPTFTGTAAPNDVVELFNGGNSLGTVTADASGNWSFTPSAPFADGDYTITARASDAAGNLSPVSSALTITVDTTAPAAPSALELDPASDTGTAGDRITGDNTPTIRGQAPAGTVSVEVLVTPRTGGAPIVLGATTVDGNGNWSFTPNTAQALADGVYNFTATASDGAGNESPVSSPLELTIDAAAPRVTLNALNTNDNTPQLTGTIDDRAARVQVRINGQTYNATNNGNGTWTLRDNAISALPEGEFNVEVIATDSSNNVGRNVPGGDGGAGGNSRPLVIDRTTPSGTITSTQPGSETDGSSGLDRFTIRFNEPVRNFDLSDVRLTRNGEPIALEGATLRSTDGGITWTLENLGDRAKIEGTYELTIESTDLTDRAGNRLTTALKGTFQVDAGQDDGIGCGRGRVFQGKGGKSDRLKGALGTDRFSGGRGKDILSGGQCSDFLDGGAGSDVLDGGTGRDTLRGGAGNDRLKGDAGDDRLSGGIGRDKLVGGSGNDVLIGQTGNDRLSGEEGDDLLIGGIGADRLSGGAGRDRFFYGATSAKGDRIIGFQVGEDVIDFSRLLRRRIAGNSNAFGDFVKLTQRGSNTVVQIDMNGKAAGGLTTMATLTGVTANTLTGSNFFLG